MEGGRDGGKSWWASERRLGVCLPAERATCRRGGGQGGCFAITRSFPQPLRCGAQCEPRATTGQVVSLVAPPPSGGGGAFRFPRGGGSREPGGWGRRWGRGRERGRGGVELFKDYTNFKQQFINCHNPFHILSAPDNPEVYCYLHF